MVLDNSVGDARLRAESIDRNIVDIATREYKFKQALSVSSTSAWSNFFWREDPTELSAGGNRNIKGIARGAAFPQAVETWSRVEAIIEKYGLEGNIPWEDILANEIDVRDRTLFRIAEGVVKAVDDEIYSALTEGVSAGGDAVGPTDMHAFGAYKPGLGEGGWNQSSAALIDDLEQAEQLIGEQNYSTANLHVYINHRDKRSVVKFLTDKGAQFPKISESTLTSSNGVLGKLGNKTFIVSKSVTVSSALVLVPKRVGSWKSLVALTTDVNEDKFKSIRIRAVELGKTEIHNPKASVLISGTNILTP